MSLKQELTAKVTPELCPTEDQLNSTLHVVLDQHAPVAQKMVKATRSMVRKLRTSLNMGGGGGAATLRSHTTQKWSDDNSWVTEVDLTTPS